MPFSYHIYILIENQHLIVLGKIMLVLFEHENLLFWEII